jgi:hypothetical protein
VRARGGRSSISSSSLWSRWSFRGGQQSRGSGHARGQHAHGGPGPQRLYDNDNDNGDGPRLGATLLRICARRNSPGRRHRNSPKGSARALVSAGGRQIHHCTGLAEGRCHRRGAGTAAACDLAGAVTGQQALAGPAARAVAGQLRRGGAAGSLRDPPRLSPEASPRSAAAVADAGVAPGQHQSHACSRPGWRHPPPPTPSRRGRLGSPRPPHRALALGPDEPPPGQPLKVWRRRE